MKNTIQFIVSIGLVFIFIFNALPCGPGYITPVFEYKHAPENPFENFAGGKIGILKPSYRRIVLFAAYRYLNGGGFTADEQKGLTDVWNAEFNNRDYKDNDVAEAVKAWIEKRKSVLPKEEKPPEIYTEREYGGYDFFPNCTKNAFETAAQTLSDRITSYGADNKDVKDWLTAQDQVFTNCSSGKQTPDAPNQTMPEWLQKDRAYQLAAADFYSLDYENAKRQFAEIAQDSQSPWQTTADYLVARTLIRQASLTDNEAKSNPLYTEAEERLQTLVAKGGKFGDSSERLLGLVKYRLHPQERVGELGRNLSVQSGNQNFRQDLIDYNWLLDRFAKETLEKEEKRKEELKPQDANANYSTNKMNSSYLNANLTLQNNTNTEGLLSIYFYNDDYSKNWTISVKSDATDEEAIAEAEKAVGAPLTDKMKVVVRNARQTAYASRFSSSSASEYKGGYYGSEEMSLSILPDFLRTEDLTDWLFAFQIENTEAYLYALSKFRQSGADLWLMTALAKADKNSSELKRLLEAANQTSRFSPAYPTIAYHTARILIEQDKQTEARKLLDEILASSADLPISSRNQFLEQRMKLAETLDDFLRYAQRKPFAFDSDGQRGSIDDFINQQKSWYNPQYEEKSREEYDREVEEQYKEEKLWESRTMFDEKVIAVINQHFPLAVLIEAEKSKELPDYLQKRLALAIWTRAVILDDFVTADKITPEVEKFAPELAPFLNRYKLAKNPLARNNAALFLILKTENLTPYISSGIGLPSDNYAMYADRWWCAPYNLEYDEELGDSVPRKLSPKPKFLTKAQSDAAQAELKKLEEVGDAPKFLGVKVLEWAKRAPTDKRIPESLYIVYEANGWSKYGCGNNDELRQQSAIC